MKGRAGKSAIALFLCLIFLSALLFIFLESKKVSKAQSLTSANPDALVEIVDPEAFIGAMNDYEYDLYRKDGDRFTFVPPPELDYADPASIDDVTLNELQVATEPIPDSSRQVTITLTAICPCPPPCPAGCSTLTTGRPLLITYQITPATKTVLLENGATQLVYILPSRVDMYVAVRTPSMNRVFLNRLSAVQRKFYSEPVVFLRNMAINVLSYPLLGILMPGNFPPGPYKVYVVMVPPGQKLFGNPYYWSNWISDLGMVEFNYNFAQTQ
ncbi:MAG: hypothetical protein NTX71_05830 [Candidatus Aureabacteria bacterium]|nr:hypothetical protein [Candidatus Auribacterota bacterium]